MLHYILQYVCFDVRRDLIPTILLQCIVLYIFSYYEPAFSLNMATYIAETCSWLSPIEKVVFRLLFIHKTQYMCHEHRPPLPPCLFTCFIKAYRRCFVATRKQRTGILKQHVTNSKKSSAWILAMPHNFLLLLRDVSILITGFFPLEVQSTGNHYEHLLRSVKNKNSLKVQFILFALCCINTRPQRLQWCRGSVLASDTQVRGFKPGRSRRIFTGR